MTIRLKYGNTNTYLVGGLLLDTDLPGTLPALWREMKRQGIAPETICYVFATHYHPDHMGLIGDLSERGVKWLLLDRQREYVHSSDAILSRDRRVPFVPFDESRATVITERESRAFLSSLGIAGEIVPTVSHSPDGAALVLDDGNAFVGDLEPLSFLDGYAPGAAREALRADWTRLLALGVKTVHFGHANDTDL